MALPDALQPGGVRTIGRPMGHHVRMTRRARPDSPRPPAPRVTGTGFLPPLGAGSVERHGLLAALRLPDVAAVLAPPGSGKTTLVIQHALRQERPNVWVTLDAHDDDAVVLVTKFVDAIERVSEIDDSVRRGLAAPGTSIWATVMPRLLAALATLPPSLIVFDDIHELSSQEALDVLEELALSLPTHSQIVLVGRPRSGLPLARIRLARGLLEIGAEELRFSDAEALELLSSTGVQATVAEAKRLNERCEGWPAGLRMAALSGSASGPGSLVASSLLTGGDRVITEYVRTELLTTLSPEESRFMLQSSVLRRMSPALCDFVLQQSGSAAMLRGLERADVFVMALAGDERWYRCHDLIREALLAELQREDAALPALLRARASEWHAANLMPAEAVHYRQEVGDDAATVRMMATYAQQLYGEGRTGTITGWWDWVEAGDLLRVEPELAMSGALALAMSGEAERAERFAGALHSTAQEGSNTHGDPGAGAWQALLRSLFCERGAAQCLVDAELACELIPPANSWRRPALMALGLASLIEGDADEAEAVLSNIGGERAIEGTAPNARAIALGLRAQLALARSDLSAARGFLAAAEEIRRIGALREQGPQALQDALSARVAIALADPGEARRRVAHAQKLRPQLTWAMPGLALITRLELARASLSLADVPGARTLVLEIGDILHRRPDLGVLNDEVEDVRAQLAEMRSGVVGASTLTAAELRIIPMLATHLTVAEISDRLTVSENTIKSHVGSVYRKLDATSRSEAVEHAVRAGLIDPAAMTAIVLGDPDARAHDPQPSTPSGGRVRGAMARGRR